MQADTNIGCLLGRLSMIGVAFVYPRINRLEMPGTEPKLLRSGETTPIMLSVTEVWAQDESVCRYYTCAAELKKRSLATEDGGALR